MYLKGIPRGIWGGEKCPYTQQNTCVCEKVNMNMFSEGRIETSGKHTELILMLEC